MTHRIFMHRMMYLKLALEGVRNVDKQYLVHIYGLKKRSPKLYQKIINKFNRTLYIQQKVIMNIDMLSIISTFLNDIDYYKLSLCSKIFRKRLLSFKWLPTVMYNNQLTLFFTDLRHKMLECDKEAKRIKMNTKDLVKTIVGLDIMYDKMYISHYQYCKNYKCSCKEITYLYNNKYQIDHKLPSYRLTDIYDKLYTEGICIWDSSNSFYHLSTNGISMWIGSGNASKAKPFANIIMKARKILHNRQSNDQSKKLQPNQNILQHFKNNKLNYIKPTKYPKNNKIYNNMYKS